MRNISIINEYLGSLTLCMLILEFSFMFNNKRKSRNMHCYIASIVIAFIITELIITNCSWYLLLPVYLIMATIDGIIERTKSHFTIIKNAVIIVGILAFIMLIVELSEVSSDYNIRKLLIISCAYFVVYLLVKSAKKLVTSFLTLIDWVMTIGELVISMIIILVIGLLRNGSSVIKFEWVYLLVIISVIMIDLIFFHMLVRIQEENIKASGYERVAQRLYNQEQYLKSVYQIDGQVKKIRHDITNQLNVISVLLDSGDIQGAQKYLEEYKRESGIAQKYVTTDNEVVNAVINSKIMMAKDRNIEMLISVHKHIKKMQDTDICSLLGNILDNAIEAETKIYENRRLIELEILWDNDDIVVVVRNFIEDSVLNNNPKMSTSKRDTHNHGIGTKIINDIMNRYDGIVDYYEVDNMFICEVRW